MNVQHLVDRFAIDPSLEVKAADIILEELEKEVSKKGTFVDYIHRAMDLGLLGRFMNDAIYCYADVICDAVERTSFRGRYRYKGLTILMDRYFLKDSDGTFLENPAYFYMRVALGCYKAWDLTKEDTIKHVLELFDDLQSFRFSNSTPTLFNAGKTESQMSSCFLNSAGDDTGEIMATGAENAFLSKNAGGIATYWGLLRGNGAPIKGVAGKAAGVIKYMKLNEQIALCFDQEGKRKGSFCNYLDIWHPDIEMFLDLRNETGDPRMRTPDANTGVCIPDIFMRKVIADHDWILFDPYYVPLHSVWGQEFDDMYYKAQLDFVAGKIPGKRISAKSLWRTLCERYVATGHPFPVFRDTMNRAFGEDNVKEFGIIRSSNLCVAPETEILTDRGYFTIESLENEVVNVWNGLEFSETTVVRTGENQKLITVSFSNGEELDCTPYHKFYVQKTYHDNSVVEVRASELNAGDKLIKFDLPVIDQPEWGDFYQAYTHGFFTADGTYGKGKPRVSLYGIKKDLLPYLAIIGGTGVSDSQDRLNYRLDLNLAPKYEVPNRHSLKSRLEWFAGLCDGDGTIARNGSNEQLQVSSIDKEFLIKVRRMLQTLGIDSKVSLMREECFTYFDKGGDYLCQPSYRLLITSCNLVKLIELGFAPKRLTIDINQKPQRDAAQFVKVVSVTNKGRFDDTFCFTEPKRHMGLFNGVLTGQCTEITQPSNPGYTTSCNLGSLNLVAFWNEDLQAFDFSKLEDTVINAVFALNAVIDSNWNPVGRIDDVSKHTRFIGLGTMAWADLAQVAKIPFDSEEFGNLAESISQSIYMTADWASRELLTHERYASFKDRKRLNPLILATAPTATISKIIGVSSGRDPTFANIFSDENLSGIFATMNYHLVTDLTKQGLWNDKVLQDIIANEGGIQNLDYIPEATRRLYRTAFEMDQIQLVRNTGKCQKWVCQSQSHNVYLKSRKGKDISEIIMTAWKEGVKTLYYCRTPAASSIEAVKATNMGDMNTACAYEPGKAPPDCEACQ